MKINKNAETLGAVHTHTHTHTHTLYLLKIKNGINKSGIRNKGHPL